MRTIDARGLACPKPLQLTEEALSRTGEGMVEVLVDNESAVQNLEWLGGKLGIYTENEAREGHWAVKFVKGVVCGSGASPEKEKTAKSLMLVISTDSFGKDEALGRKLVKAFFETMAVTKELPNKIFFLNTGVRLTTTEEEIVPVLKKLADMNVEIFSCGTCLDYFGLKDSLKVGLRGTSDILVCGLKDSDKTVWI